MFMPKTLTLFLFTSPYMSQHSHTAMKLAEAALAKGYQVNIFASADGVYNFTKGHKAKGLPNAEKRFGELIEQGLRVQLCGTCYLFRGISKESFAEGAEPSSMQNLFALAKQSDAFLTLSL